MIDLRLLRENPNLISEGLKSRGMDVDLGPLQKFCKDLKELEEKRNSLQAQGNSIGKEVGQKIKQGQIVGTLGQSGRATGPHLDIRLNWFDVKLDPASILN